MYVATFKRLPGIAELPAGSSKLPSMTGLETTAGLCNENCFETKSVVLSLSEAPKISAQKPLSQKNSTGFGSS
jgi:hypothetical protein